MGFSPRFSTPIFFVALGKAPAPGDAAVYC